MIDIIKECRSIYNNIKSEECNKSLDEIPIIIDTIEDDDLSIEGAFGQTIHLKGDNIGKQD